MPSSELTLADNSFAELMLPLSEKDWSVLWVWSDHAEEGIRRRLHCLAAHKIQHAMQIDETLAAIGLSQNESKQLIVTYTQLWLMLLPCCLVKIILRQMA